MPGTLFLVATPIGNLEDVTARALRVLREAALIAAEDTRRTAQLLSRYAIQTPTTSLHEHNETGKAPALIERLRAGQSIALVSDAGTPLISDPGGELVRLAIDAGIRVEPVPGPTAIIASLAASGFPTHPFMFLGFPPTRAKDRREWMALLRSAKCSVVFFEAPHRIRQTLSDILLTVGDLQGVVCRELTKAHEELVRGPISVIAHAPSIERGELTIVLDGGHSPEISAAVMATDQELLLELGRITKDQKLSKRRAIQVLARQHGRKPNEVYEALERAKASGK
jgi:16S rRNA (cytidine1402-2'-O)-methyltransferase